jgi:hypothetical protein
MIAWRSALPAKPRWPPYGFGEKKDVSLIPLSQDSLQTHSSSLPIARLPWICFMAFCAI